MKLSEAIRLGAMLKPQTSGVFYRAGKTCANGAALDAIGALDIAANPYCGSRNERLKAEFPLVRTLIPRCPVCFYTSLLEWVIVHLNDDHRWTREQIADWVATVESAISRDVVSGEPARTSVVDSGVPT
jgi:hypothetical protein